jgi:hypothetical protein
MPILLSLIHGIDIYKPNISDNNFNLVTSSLEENQRLVKAKLAILEQIYKGAE